MGSIIRGHLSTPAYFLTRHLSIDPGVCPAKASVLTWNLSYTQQSVLPGHQGYPGISPSHAYIWYQYYICIMNILTNTGMEFHTDTVTDTRKTPGEYQRILTNTKYIDADTKIWDIRYLGIESNQSQKSLFISLSLRRPPWNSLCPQTKWKMTTAMLAHHVGQKWLPKSSMHNNLGAHCRICMRSAYLGICPTRVI